MWLHFIQGQYRTMKRSRAPLFFFRGTTPNGLLDSDATLEMTGSCKINTTFASECFANAKAAIGKAAATARTLSGNDPTKPVGCSVSMGNGTDVEIYFNTASEGAA